MIDTAALWFTYDTRAVRVVFGAGALEHIGAELDREGLRRVLMLITPRRAGDLDAVVEKLGDRLAGTYAGARQHVPANAVQAAREVAERVQPDALLTLGGGSTIGLGKAIAQKTGLPLLAIPTTYSGSEMTAIWGVTDGAVKRTGRDPRVAPQLVIYDPELTKDLPPSVSAASGMNAIAHCVEAAYAPNASPVSNLLAWDGIRRLADSLPEIMREPRSLAARTEALAGAHLAGRALDMTAMGLHHRLCHVLGGRFGLPHAETHAALLPCVVAFNAPAAREQLARVADALRADDAATGLADLARALGTPKLKELGFKADQVADVARLATETPIPNPRAVDEQAVRGILEDALTA